MFDSVLITPEHKFRFDIFYKNKVYRKLINFDRKKNKISSVHVKDKSCNGLEGQQVYPKGTLTQVFSCEYSYLFRGSFFIEKLYSFSIKKEFKKRKVETLISFALIDFFQKSANRSTTTRVFVCHLSLYFSR